jgi:hypothetical protein
MGFAQTYSWTKDVKYLETAIKCAEYFLGRMKEGEGKWHHHMIPLWDFDAPQDDLDEPLRDVSAGVIAANGLLIIHQSLQGLPSSVSAQLSSTDFLDIALEIVSETLDMSYDRDLASFEGPKPDMVNGEHKNAVFNLRSSGFECILRYSTTNWNEHAHKKYKDHGLVYADYYLLEFGNKLLRAGIL